MHGENDSVVCMVGFRGDVGSHIEGFNGVH